MSINCGAIVIGAGFYGCEIALKLHNLGIKNIFLFEKSSQIMTRASMWNQARIHNGYHYPRSLATGLAANKYFDQFMEDYPTGINKDMRKIYAIAHNSNVSTVQFERFCKKIKSPLKLASPKWRNMFESRLINEVYEAEEYVFNAQIIQKSLTKKIKSARINLKLNSDVKIQDFLTNCVYVKCDEDTYVAPIVFNCTYSALDQMGINLQTEMRKEWAELALITPPKELNNLGITVMDGPFFSSMPFPSYSLHTLSHVRYTPVAAWSGKDQELNIKSGIGPPLNAEAMLRDAQRYMPIISKSKITKSFFEIKAVLKQNDQNDGRPILFEVSKETPRVISILGGKIDNIYDVLERIDHNFIEKIIKN